jgi:hypothetical protein
LDSVDENLKKNGTSLLISIERPSPNDKGQMSNMSAQNIGRYNADMSGLFTGNRAWDTIGIGDGGNEIGTGAFKEDTENLEKPTLDPVVNNGDKIAASIETDIAVAASVSNNGGVAVALATEAVLTDLLATDIKAKHDARPASVFDTLEAKPPLPALAIVEGYKGTIASMQAEGISIDGVFQEQREDQTVDGRRLLRPSGAKEQPLGSEGATHQDMFDKALRIMVKN